MFPLPTQFTSAVAGADDLLDGSGSTATGGSWAFIFDVFGGPGNDTIATASGGGQSYSGGPGTMYWTTRTTPAGSLLGPTRSRLAATSTRFQMARLGLKKSLERCFGIASVG